MKIITCDIETSDGLNGCKFELGVIYDGENYKIFRNCNEFCKAVISYNGKYYKMYYHNLAFDGRFLQQYFLENGIKFETVYRNSDLLCLKVKQLYANLQILDSYALIPTALDKFTKIFHLDTKKQSLENLELRCKTDCKILYDGLNKFFEILPIAKECYTLSQTALEQFKSNCCCKFNFTSDGVKVNEELEDNARLGYCGGRTEIFNLALHEKSYCYDINSLYPFVMRNKLYPISIKEVKPNKDVLKEELYYIKAKINLPYTYIPQLPIKLNKLMFCYGKMEGWFYSPEFNIIKDYCDIIEIKKAYIFSPCMLFKEFVDKYYGLRLQYKKEGNGLEYVMKILLNSLYGKFAQQRIKTSYEYTSSLLNATKELFDGIYVKEIQRKNTSANINPFISSFVTSYARTEILKYLDEESIQTDTDSVFTPKQMPTGLELGQMKLEYICDIKAISPKTYWIKNNKGEIGYYFDKENKVPIYTKEEWIKLKKLKIRCYSLSKCKGVISSQIPICDDFNDYIRNITNSNWKIYSKSKESIKRYGNFLTPKFVVKSLSLEYNKRKILSDLSTKPFNYKEIC